MRKLVLALVAAAVVAAVAVAVADDGDDDGAARPAQARPPAVEGTRGCRERIEGGSTGRGAPRTGPDDIVIGPVTFFGLRRAATARRSQFPPPVNGRDPSWKAAIAVTAGPPIVLAVADARERGVTLQYDMRKFRGGRASVRGGDAAVRIAPCPPETESWTGGPVGPYTAFNGGFLLGRRTCVEVQVFRGGRMWSRAISFGTRGRGCPPS